MNIRTLAALALGALLLSPLDARPAKVGVVVAVSGPVSRHAASDPPSRKPPVKLLSTVHEGDSLQVGQGGSVTISVLSTGSRFKLSGPQESVVPPKGAFQIKKGLVEESKQAAREGIVATQEVNFAKMGGGSGRSLARFYTDQTAPKLALDVLPREVEFSTPGNAGIVYRDTQGGDWKSASASVRHQDDGVTVIVPQFSLTPGKSYFIQLSAQPPQGEPDFWIYCYSPDDLRGLRSQEQLARGVEGEIELLESYRKLQLFDRAKEKLQALKTRLPEAADWGALTGELENERRAAQSGSGR